MSNINRLLLAVVQVQDERKAIRALNQAGLSVTRLSSVGAFLGRRNVTLMIGLNQAQEEIAVRAIHENCHERVEYVSTPLEGAPLPIPLSTPIIVGGATVFTIEVERFEEL
jgi:uncharacterized protein YaaQ